MSRKVTKGGNLGLKDVPDYSQTNVVDIDAYLKILKSGDGITVKFDTAKRDIFFRTLLETSNVSLACVKAGITKQTAYKYRDKDPVFAAAWKECVDVAIDRLEQEAFRRGYTGVDKPVYWQGRKVDTIKEYSDQILGILLKAHIPKYRLGDALPLPPIGNLQVIDVSKVPTELLEQLQKYVMVPDGEK